MAMKKKPSPAPVPSTGNPPILLRLPPAIGMPLMRDAGKTGKTIQTIILEIVAAHYSVEIDLPRPGRQKKNLE